VDCETAISAFELAHHLFGVRLYSGQVRALCVQHVHGTQAMMTCVVLGMAGAALLSAVTLYAAVKLSGALAPQEKPLDEE
jgi:hypothetical protein